MDRVRFGRALGYAARHAGKAVAQAVDAATTPDPTRPVTAQETAKTNAMGAMEERNVRDGSARRVARTAGRSFFAPLASFSKTLWLEVTGTFFALVALATGSAAWKLRAAVHLPPVTHEAQRLYLCTAIFAAFAYFAVSSFVRARRA
jgi:hypothetical protein